MSGTNVLFREPDQPAAWGKHQHGHTSRSTALARQSGAGSSLPGGAAAENSGRATPCPFPLRRPDARPPCCAGGAVTAAAPPARARPPSAAGRCHRARPAGRGAWVGSGAGGGFPRRRLPRWRLRGRGRPRWRRGGRWRRTRWPTWKRRWAAARHRAARAAGSGRRGPSRAEPLRAGWGRASPHRPAAPRALCVIYSTVTSSASSLQSWAEFWLLGTIPCMEFSVKALSWLQEVCFASYCLLL